MLIGHGSLDGTEYKISMPAPDLTGIELASLLERLPGGTAVDLMEGLARPLPLASQRCRGDLCH